MLGGKGKRLHPSEIEVARDLPLHSSAGIKALQQGWGGMVLCVVGQGCHGHLHHAGHEYPDKISHKRHPQALPGWAGEEQD